MSTLERFFKKQLGDEFLSLAQRLEIAVADHCDDRHSALDLVLQDGGLSLNAISTLQFAKHVLEWTGNNLEICGYIFDELGATNSEGLASLLFPRAQFDEGMRRNPNKVPEALTAEAVRSLYSNFFEDQQLLVMLVLLRKRRFSLREELQKIAENCFLFTLLGNGNANDPELPKYVSQQMIKLDEGIPPPSDTDLTEGLQVFKSIIVLCRVVQDPEDVPLLHQASFDSVRQITQQVKKDFSAKMLDVGMALENALRIHDCAESVDCWNEHLWLSLMQSRRLDFVPISNARPNVLNPGGSPNRPLNNLTDIFKLEDSGCEECCSVTGLCAYLADLLLFLRNTKTPKINSLDSKSLGIYGGRNDTIMDQDLLQLLFSRRPDIRKLELTCANSQTLLPYISLVTEVLESYIRSVEVPPLAPSDLLEDSIRAYQTPASVEESSDGNSPEFQYRPANTDYEVYQKLISRPMYPLKNFPYDLSRDITLSTFGVWELEFANFVKLFRSPEQLLALVLSASSGRTDERLREALEKGPKEIFDRQFTAEVLGLQPAEFWAITNETFFPSAWTDLVNGLSPTALKIDKALNTETCALWGFDSNDEMLDIERGLSLIKNKLMAKSDLEFQDVMDLVKTQCFSQQLVVTNSIGSQQFGPLIEGLRLLSNASAPPFQPLTNDLAFQLQAFIRLRQKLKWSIADLDAAIVALRNLELDTVTNTSRPKRPKFLPRDHERERHRVSPLVRPDDEWQNSLSEIPAITPFVIKGIASLKRLSEISGLEPVELTALWAPLNTYGDKSFLCRRFMTRRLQQIDSIFSLHKDTSTGSVRFFTPEGIITYIRDHSRGICAALNWPPAYFDSLVTAAGCTNKRLDIESFSSIYRYALICKIIGVSAKQCKDFYDVFFAENPHILSSPLVTVEAIERWKFLVDSGWDIESMVDLLVKNRHVDENRTRAANEAALRYVIEISSGARSILQSVPSAVQGSVQAVDYVADCASRIFDASVAQAVVELVENSQPLSQAVLIRMPLLQELSEALSKLSDAETLSISQPAISSQDTKTQARESRDHDTDSDNNDEDSKQAAKLEAARLAAEKSSLEATIRLRKRRSTFIEFAIPKITEDLLDTFLVNSIQKALPDTEPALIPVLLHDLVSIPTQDGKPSQSALSALRDLTKPNSEAVTSECIDGYFSPPTSDVYTFGCSGINNTTQPSLSVNNLDLQYDPDSESFTEIRLTVGKPYRLRCNIGNKFLTWSTTKASPSFLTEAVLMSTSIAARAALIIGTVKRIAQVCDRQCLTVDELQYIALNQNKPGQTLGLNFNKLTLTDLLNLTKYSELRKSSAGNPGTLVGLVTALSHKNRTVTMDSVASSWVDATGWDKTRVLEALQAKYPGLPTEAVMSSLTDFSQFLNFADIMAFDEKLKTSCTGGALPTMSELFHLAQPRLSLSVSSSDFHRAIKLQDGLTPSQKNEIDILLTPKRRDVLVQYLLHQGTVRNDLNIKDADGLFEHLLIDVQMGPHLRTSRVKQAISVVQLFVQRCLLGLEDGVPKTAVTRSKWSWMRHYTLWEAHRKLFLYPENWLEPSLRDDKSQLFEKVETVLMQKNLTVGTFLGAIQDYIYDLNGISSLDIVSYLHEPHKGAEDIFHLFGRTRTAPHTFYYRTLTVYVTDRSVFWQPWTKIDLDIPSVEADWDSKRLQSSGAYLAPILLEDRLYIFFPQIAVTTSQSTLQPSGSQSMTWTQMGSSSVAGQSPKTSWEITMAWSEYVKGGWSPKRISPGSLNIEPRKLQAQGLDRLPSAWEFRIDPLYEAKRVRLVISYAPETSLTGEVVGEFNFARDQVTANQDAKIALPRSQFSTRFGKVQGTNSILFTPGFKDNMKDPLVWMPSDVAWQKEDINWTLSKTPYRMTGLVLNVREEDGSSRSYFNVPEKDLLETRWTQETIASRMKLRSIDHSFSERLMQAVANHTEPLDKIYNTLSTVPTDEWADCYGADVDVYYHELASPCALYNWELGVHSIMLGVDRFMSTQQFDEALQIARLLFDPTVDHQIDRQEAGQLSCWKFPPFRDISDRIDVNGNTETNFKSLTADLQLAIKDRRSYGQLAHAAARGRPQAYMKWIVIKYGEILLAAGDKHFREGTLESLPLAIQRYVEAARVFGPEPVKGLKMSKRTAMCFEDVIKDEIRFYLDLPFTAQLKRNMDPIKGSASAKDIDPNRETHRSFIMSSYFCVPLNPKFKKLRSLVHERLYNIRNSLDINGNPIVYALREPPIDPGSLISLNPGGTVGGDMTMVLADQNMPLTRYRFEVKINKALELCGELRSLADRFLAAIEKKEAEELNALRARNSTLIQGLMLEIKQTQLREAQQALESLSLSRESQVSQLSYFLESIGESSSLVPNASQDWVDLVQDIGPITQDDMRMTAYEKAEMDLASTAAGLNIIAASIDQAAQVYAILPTMSANIQPFGVGCSISAGGSSIASAIQIGAMVMRTNGMIAAEESNQAGRKGRMARQLQERRLQANMKGREIKATDKQIEMQKTRILAVEKEIESQRVSVEDAAQAEAYNRTKYTNQQLYAWMESGLHNLYFQGYNLAATAAQQAESSLSFERGRKVSILKPSGYWNTSRDGLLAADNLYLDLRRLEALYLEGPRWDYEIAKTVSLRQINPLALLRLRVNGSTDFSISEHQYDLDFPGHYMRRIRSVSVSIPAVIGPHSGLNATLSLTKSQYRINSTAATAKEYLATNSESHRSDRVPISSIAISSGASDAGAFELNFSGPKYLPFEGAGAISSWRLTLPCEIPKFDYGTISDVLLHIQYTSLDGGECLKAAANEAVRLTARSVEAEGKSEGFYAMLDLKNDFPNSWHAFKTSLISSYKATKTANGRMELGDIRDRLPFWSRRQNKLVVQSIALVSRSAKLIRGTAIPLATGDDPVIDDGHLGTGRSSMAIKTFLDMSQENLNGWVIETAGKVIEEKDQTVENMYMLVKYFFG